MRPPGSTGRAPSAGPDRYAIELMLDEIRSAPDVIASHLSAPDPAIDRLARSLVEEGVDNIYMTGCGDSYLAGAAAALAFARHAGVAAEGIHALDLARYRVRYLPEKSAVLCVSSSGEVGRTIEAAAQAREFGHRVIALTGSDKSRLAAESRDILALTYPAVGATPGTISYLAMLMTLFELALSWGAARGRDRSSARTSLERAPTLAADTIARNEEPAAQLAERLANHSVITFVGAGPNEATARFGAAKLLEGPQMRGVATNLEEWAHGEYFVTRDNQAVIVVAPSGTASRPSRRDPLRARLHRCRLHPDQRHPCGHAGKDHAADSDRPARGILSAAGGAAAQPARLSPGARPRQAQLQLPQPAGGPGALRHHSPRHAAAGRRERARARRHRGARPPACCNGPATPTSPCACSAGPRSDMHRHRPLPAALQRTYGDIDVVVKRGHDHGLKQALEELGYVPNKRFNGLHGDRRLLFYDDVNNRQVDVFIGNFRMCHTLELNDRLGLDAHTLAPADLLLTKLQIVKINAKDVVDSLCPALHPRGSRPSRPPTSSTSTAWYG